MNTMVESMGRSSRWIFAVACVLLSTIRDVQSGFMLESRLTQLNVDTGFGFLGGITPGSDSRQVTAIDTDFQVVMSGGDGGSGALSDGSWIANFNYSIEQVIDLTPNGVVLSGSNNIFAFAGDQGVVSVSATNRSELRLVVTEGQLFDFVGNAQGATILAVDQSIGIDSWLNITTVYGGSSINQSVNLAAGTYRMTLDASSFTDGSQVPGETWSLSMQSAVPEPSSAFAIGFVAIAFGLKKWLTKRSKLEVLVAT